MNNVNDYTASFHIYRLEWTSGGIKFFVDDEMIGQVTPPAGGFWQMGGFTGPNIWSNSSMAPFDKPVRTFRLPFRIFWSLFEILNVFKIVSLYFERCCWRFIFPRFLRQQVHFKRQLFFLEYNLIMSSFIIWYRPYSKPWSTTSRSQKK